MGVHEFTEDDISFENSPVEVRHPSVAATTPHRREFSRAGVAASSPNVRQAAGLSNSTSNAQSSPALNKSMSEPMKGTQASKDNSSNKDKDKPQAPPPLDPKQLFAASVVPEQIAKMQLAGISLATDEDFAFAKPTRPRKIFVKPTTEDQGIEMAPLAVEKTGLGGKSFSFSEIPYVGAGGHEDSGGPLEFSFADIVERDQDELYDTFVQEQLVGRFLESTLFRVTILFVILLNSITVGIQTDPETEKRLSRVWQSCDVVFLTIFVIEILLKWYNGFWAFWRVGWNVFDFFIVAISILGSGVSFVSSSRVLRILRVLRAFRTLRSISALQGLQVIVQTVLQSLPDMGNILLLLGIITFIFAVIGINLFGAALPQHYGDLGKAMFTLFIGTTQDGWVNIVKDAEAKGSSTFTGYAIYMPIFIVLGAFVFANLISGVVVTNVQNAYKESKATRKARNRRLHRTGQNMVGENRQVRPTADIKNVKPNVWSSQVPLELPDPAKFTVPKLENYFLVVTAMEDNLAEHQSLKRKLESILNDIKEINETYAESEMSSWSEDEDSYGGNDALTRLLRRNQTEADRNRRREARNAEKDQERREAVRDAIEERRSKVLRAEEWIMGGLQDGMDEDDWSGTESVTPPLRDSPVSHQHPSTQQLGGLQRRSGRGAPILSRSMAKNRSFTSTSNLLMQDSSEEDVDIGGGPAEDKKAR